MQKTKKVANKVFKPNTKKSNVSTSSYKGTIGKTKVATKKSASKTTKPQQPKPQVAKKVNKVKSTTLQKLYNYCATNSVVFKRFGHTQGDTGLGTWVKLFMLKDEKDVYFNLGDVDFTLEDLAKTVRVHSVKFNPDNTVSLKLENGMTYLLEPHISVKAKTIAASIPENTYLTKLTAKKV